MSMSDKEMQEQAEAIVAANFPAGDQAGVVLKEMYDSLKTGGFTEKQALWLVGYVLTRPADLDEPDADKS